MANYTLTENDYYDAEKDQYVISFRGNVIIHTELTIIDGDFDWNCYLVSVRYNNQQNTYTLVYKTY